MALSGNVPDTLLLRSATDGWPETPGSHFGSHRVVVATRGGLVAIGLGGLLATVVQGVCV